MSKVISVGTAVVATIVVLAVAHKFAREETVKLLGF